MHRVTIVFQRSILQNGEDLPTSNNIKVFFGKIWSKEILPKIECSSLVPLTLVEKTSAENRSHSCVDSALFTVHGEVPGPSDPIVPWLGRFCAALSSALYAYTMRWMPALIFLRATTLEHEWSDGPAQPMYLHQPPYSQPPKYVGHVVFLGGRYVLTFGPLSKRLRGHVLHVLRFAYCEALEELGKDGEHKRGRSTFSLLLGLGF